MATKTKKKPASSASDRYAGQVGAEAKLKFGPETDSLASALRDAQSTFETDKDIAHGTRRAIEHAATTAKPRFAADNKTAVETVQGVKSSLAADLQKLPQGGTMAGATARDSAGTERRLAEMLAGANAETESRRRDAAAGEGFAVQNANSRLATARGKVTDRQQSLAGEIGAFAQARSGELVEDSRDRGVTRRGQDKTADTAAANRRTSNANQDATRDETARHNRAMEDNAADSKNGRKPATPKETQSAKTAITRALEQAKRLQGKDGLKRGEAATALVNGRPGVTIKEAPKDMKMSDGTEYKAGDPLEERHITKIPEVKAGEELYSSVALDIAYDGHLSTKNMKLLQRMGLSVKELGLKTEGRSGTSRPSVVPAPKKPKPRLNVSGPLGGLPKAR